jgi:putative SOS response-associated peptidase YedK
LNNVDGKFTRDTLLSAGQVTYLLAADCLRCTRACHRGATNAKHASQEIASLHFDDPFTRRKLVPLVRANTSWRRSHCAPSRPLEISRSKRTVCEVFYLAARAEPRGDPIPGPHLVYGFLTTAPNAVVEPIHPKANLLYVFLKDEEAAAEMTDRFSIHMSIIATGILKRDIGIVLVLPKQAR